MKSFFILSLTVLLFTSCVEKKTGKKETQTTNPATSGGTTGGGTTGGGTTGGGTTGGGTTGGGTGVIDTSCNARGIGNSEFDDYHRVSAVFRGHGGPGLNWSTLSAPYFANDNQNLLITDSRFNVRVVVRPSPGGGPGSSQCPNMAVDYTKLSFRIGLKASDSAPGYYTTRNFNNILIDQCTDVVEFNVPSVNNPLVLDLYDVRWNYCVGGPCGIIDFVWPNDCVELEVQISTDYTKDIPHY